LGILLNLAVRVLGSSSGSSGSSSSEAQIIGSAGELQGGCGL
jgi:hypothetical protein